ncbi:MAG TPA: DUF2062 domain-containing protein [Candidatus Omnitrophota bacterium]|nr:DUF2062 domain-containing protein [Candidatus Omnitrophota bacterium]HPT07656.1 DUF2062 domain-containing protein [Candidatus Omnitrophota bacterium]
MKRIKKQAAARFFKLVYHKLCRMNDSPQRIAIGFGVGVFLGVMPGLGLIAAIVMASVLRVNKASAIIATLITNTWLSVIMFIASIKVGSWIMKLDWHVVYANSEHLIKDFHWKDLFNVSIIQIALPLIIGFLIVSILMSIGTYLIILFVVTRVRAARKAKLLLAKIKNKWHKIHDHSQHHNA